MEKIYHYTSERNWEAIKNSGFLLPLSSPNNFKIIKSQPLKLRTSLVNFFQCKNTSVRGLYTVGLAKLNDEKWIEYGLMPDLLEYTKGEIALEIPILNKRDSLVRDHSYLSPKTFLKEYKIDLWKLYNAGAGVYNYDERLDKAKRNYLNSTMNLEDYSWGYKVLEVWLNQKTPVELIKGIKL